MDVLFECCCGLDVHKNFVVACIMITPPDGEPERIVHSFGTMNEDLLKLADWLEAADAASSHTPLPRLQQCRQRSFALCSPRA